jgi:hypothetical protein
MRLVTPPPNPAVIGDAGTCGTDIVPCDAVE